MPDPVTFTDDERQKFAAWLRQEVRRLEGMKLEYGAMGYINCATDSAQNAKALLLLADRLDPRPRATNCTQCGAMITVDDPCEYCEKQQEPRP